MRCEGAYTDHLQGICTNDGDAIYWSFTDVLVKTDLDGKIVARKDVASHHGDLCFHDGRVYVAVNLGKFNQPAGQADSWIYVYDAETLDELERKPRPSLCMARAALPLATADSSSSADCPAEPMKTISTSTTSALAFQNVTCSPAAIR